MLSMSEMFTAFSGPRLLTRGTRGQIARRIAGGDETDILIFSDETGREIDLDLSGGAEAVAARYPEPSGVGLPKPGRGRPKLGVVAREVTLLPRHWDWLATQRGGASATLRRLIDTASRDNDLRVRQDAAYRFCSAIAGNLPGFEEAMRVLYSGDLDAFAAAMSDWPEDLRRHALELAGGAAS